MVEWVEHKNIIELLDDISDYIRIDILRNRDGKFRSYIQFIEGCEVRTCETEAEAKKWCIDTADKILADARAELAALKELDGGNYD